MTYQASCHCGAVRFSFTPPKPLEETEVVSCNCSICTINGYLMIYPKPADVKFDSPRDALTEYRHASKQFPHYFCKTCGTSVYADGSDGMDLMAVNARTIKGIEIEKLKLKPMDGRIYNA